MLLVGAEGGRGNIKRVYTSCSYNEASRVFPAFSVTAHSISLEVNFRPYALLSAASTPCLQPPLGVTYYPGQGDLAKEGVQMVALVIVLVLLLVQQSYLYMKMQRLLGLVVTLAPPIMDVAYPGFPIAHEEVFNDKEMAELASPEYFAVFSQAGLADKVNSLARARKNVWAAQKALRKKLEAKIPRG